MRRNSSELIYKMAIIAMLSALGVVLMLYCKLPYPFASWNEIEFSDTTILVGYVVAGWPGGIAVAVIKTLVHMLIMPQSTGAPFIGDLAAFIASMAYLFALVISSHLLRLFNKGLKFRLVGYVFVAFFVAAVMTIANLLFITPTFLAGNGTYTTCFNPNSVETVVTALDSLGFHFNYFVCIVFIYLPFNFLKAALVCGVYEILFNTLIFQVLKKNPKVQKFFRKDSNKEIKEQEDK